MAKAVLLTSEGFKTLQDELENLKTVTRNEIAEKIKIARGFGDLSENSEYDEAKNEQAILEAKIAELERQLKNVKILDDAEIDHTKVSIGSKVTVIEMMPKIAGPTDNEISEILLKNYLFGIGLITHKLCLQDICSFTDL